MHRVPKTVLPSDRRTTNNNKLGLNDYVVQFGSTSFQLEMIKHRHTGLRYEYCRYSPIFFFLIKCIRVGIPAEYYNLSPNERHEFADRKRVLSNDGV